MKRILTLGIPLLLIIGGIIWWRSAKSSEETSSFRLGVVDRGRVETEVTATGTVSAVTTVQVGSQVSGTIKDIYVDFNSPVHKGEVVARIDPTFLQAAVTEAEANVERAKASLTQAERDLTRTEDLFNKSLASQSDFDNAKTAVEVAKANLAQIQAQLERAKVNLAYAVIKSPTDGVVISRNVDVGQTVAASLQAPTLFTIAQDLRQMQIETDIDEADIGALKEGMEATFTVDAFPDEVFHGAIKQIRYAAQTSQGVVTYPVIINVSNPDLKLRPGMTANVTIVTAERNDVLRAPAVAIRFRPPESEMPKHETADTTGGGAQAAERGEASADTTGGGRTGGHGNWHKRSGESTADSTGERHKMSTLWVVGKKGMPEPRRVSLGLNDGNHVEITGGNLAAGDSVIIAMVGQSATNGAANRMPGFGGGFGRRH